MNTIWDFENCVVQRTDGRILIGSIIEDIGYDKDVIAGDVMNLLGGAARMLPGLRKARLLETCAGLRPVTPDRQPLMGPDPEVAGLYCSTGHWTLGILMTPATAQVMSESILTGKATIPEEYAVDRFMNAGVVSRISLSIYRKNAFRTVSLRSLHSIVVAGLDGVFS